MIPEPSAHSDRSPAKSAAQSATQPPAPATVKPHPAPVRFTDWASI